MTFWAPSYQPLMVLAPSCPYPRHLFMAIFFSFTDFTISWTLQVLWSLTSWNPKSHSLITSVFGVLFPSFSITQNCKVHRIYLFWNILSCIIVFHYFSKNSKFCIIGVKCFAWLFANNSPILKKKSFLGLELLLYFVSLWLRRFKLQLESGTVTLTSLRST